MSKSGIFRSADKSNPIVQKDEVSAKNEKTKDRSALKQEREKAREEQNRINAALKQEREKSREEQLRVKAALKQERDKARAAARSVRKERNTRAAAAVMRVLKDDGDGFKSLAVGPGIITVEVEGSQSELVRAAVKSGIRLHEIHSFSGGKFTLKIRKKDSANFFAICGNLCYNYRVKDAEGGSSVFARWLRRAGLLLGGVAAIAFYGASQGFIWRVEVDGLVNQPIEAVTSLLETEGVTSGIPTKNIDENLLADILIKSGKFSVAAVNLEGVTLKISVLENASFTEVAAGSNVLSKYDATVAEISVRSGTALVKTGDVVTRGAPLIEGVIYGTQGEPLAEVVPEGDVYGNVTAYYSYVLSTSKVVGVKTGREKTVTSIECFGRELFAPNPPFELYTLHVTKSSFNVFIPMSFYTYVYEEVENITTTVELNEITANIIEEKVQENEFSGLYKAAENVERLSDTLYRYTLSLSGKVKIN